MYRAKPRTLEDFEAVDVHVQFHFNKLVLEILLPIFNTSFHFLSVYMFLMDLKTLHKHAQKNILAEELK